MDYLKFNYTGLLDVATQAGKCKADAQMQLDLIKDGLNKVKGIWTGEDSDEFATNLTKAINEMEENLIIYDQIKNAIINAANELKRTQANLKSGSQSLGTNPGGRFNNRREVK